MVSDHEHPVNAERVEAVRAGGLGSAEAETLAAMLTLVADPLRARILTELLIAEEVCVGDLALALDASEDAVSYALRLLRTAGLVRRRREGRMGYYRLHNDAMSDALASSLAPLLRLSTLRTEPTEGPEYS